MSDRKVSDKLLSWVLGENVKSNELDVNTINIETGRINSFVDIRCNGFMKQYVHGPSYRINLHTFIHLAKIKACECGFHIDDTQIRVRISEMENFSEVKVFMSNDENLFAVTRMLLALEWVAEKVRGENE